MDERLKEEIEELHAGICSALADPKRIMILYVLQRGPKNVSRLAREINAPQPTTSRHLKVLRDRGMVHTHRDGTKVVYSLADEKLITAIDLLREVLRGVYQRRMALIEE
jgi:DNA-binding transcriptional ArsR family regulator